MNASISSRAFVPWSFARGNGCERPSRAGGGSRRRSSSFGLASDRAAAVRGDLTTASPRRHQTTRSRLRRGPTGSARATHGATPSLRSISASNASIAYICPPALTTSSSTRTGDDSSLYQDVEDELASPSSLPPTRDADAPLVADAISPRLDMSSGLTGRVLRSARPALPTTISPRN